MSMIDIDAVSCSSCDKRAGWTQVSDAEVSNGVFNPAVFSCNNCNYKMDEHEVNERMEHLEEDAASHVTDTDPNEPQRYRDD